MEKYPFLRYATAVLRVVGWVVLVVGVIGAIVFGVTTGGAIGAFYAIGGVIFAFLAWLFLLATREFIYIMIHIEENSRNTAQNTGITAEGVASKSE
jgi:TRAP-type mannitol/chloroaromatic compound transport system permease large subunit